MHLSLEPREENIRSNRHHAQDRGQRRSAFRLETVSKLLVIFAKEQFQKREWQRGKATPQQHR